MSPVSLKYLLFFTKLFNNYNKNNNNNGKRKRVARKTNDFLVRFIFKKKKKNSTKSWKKIFLEKIVKKFLQKAKAKVLQLKNMLLPVFFCFFFDFDWFCSHTEIFVLALLQFLFGHGRISLCDVSKNRRRHRLCIRFCSSYLLLVVLAAIFAIEKQTKKKKKRKKKK